MPDTPDATPAPLDALSQSLLAENFRRLGLPYVATEPSLSRSPLASGVSAGRRAELLAMTESGRRVLADERAAR